MSYPFLRKGNKLPAVGVIQRLLNRSGASLTVDGDFGSKTEAAVRKFQDDRRMVSDGRIGVTTFPRLVAGENGLRVLDLIDVFDPALADLEARDIRNSGGIAITIPGMSNGIEQAVMEVVASVANGSVFLLRIHGHGAAGVAGISDGHGVDGEHGTSIGTNNMDYVGPFLSLLRPIFSPFGCIQFMHCKSGNGPQGRTMLNGVSAYAGVPATGAINDQQGGGLNTFKYEGPTHTSYPGGRSLSSWSQTLPVLPQKSVP